MAGKKKNRTQKPVKKQPDLPTPLENCQKLTDWYMTAILGIFPLVIGRGEYGYINIIETKARTWLILTGLWVLCLGAYLIWCRVRRAFPPVRFGWVQWTALLFWAVQVVSAALSERPGSSFFQINDSNTNSVLFITSYVAAFLGISLFGKLRRGHILALTFSVSASGAISLLQLCGLNPLTLYPEGLNYFNKHQEYAGAFLGTMGNVDHLTAFLCFAVPILVVFALRSRKKLDRLLLIPAALSLYILYAIDVDAGKVGILGCLVLALPVVVRGKKAAKWACAGCGCAALAGLAAVYFWPGSKGFLWEASQILHGNIKPSFGHDRVEIWIEAWRCIRERPIFGSGPGSGAWLYQAIRKVNSKWDRVTTVFNTHNVYLGYLTEGGIFALAGYLALLASACAGWIRARNDDAAAALGAGVCCYLIQDFFSLGLVTTAPLLWLGLGILVHFMPKTAGEEPLPQ